MANIRRRTAICAVVTVLMGVQCGARGTELRQAEDPDSAGRKTGRVRSDDPEIRRLIADGERRSPTFRALIGRIQRTDGIVYVEEDTCGRGVRACLVMAVTMAGPYRLLRVRLDPQKSDDEAMASLGHELRHAVEILSEPNITTGSEMYLYYKRFGTWLREASFETAAATADGDAIRRELARTPPDPTNTR
jgi:hypothetical protein